MRSNERIDRLIKEKLEHLYESPPDYVLDNILQNSSSRGSSDSQKQMDEAIKRKLLTLSKEPPEYIWLHVQYYLELLNIWYNLKRILLWRRIKRTLTVIAGMLATFLIVEFPLNNYGSLLSDMSQAHRLTSLSRNKPGKNINTKSNNPSESNRTDAGEIKPQNLFAQNIGLPSDNPKHYEKSTQTDYQQPYIWHKETNEEQKDNSESNIPPQMSQLPSLNIPIKAPSVDMNLSKTTSTNISDDKQGMPIWQIDMGSQFSILFNEYLIQSIFGKDMILVNPGVLSSFYLGRIIVGKSGVYRIGLVYGGFDSKVSVWVDGRWNKEIMESRYIGISGSIGKLLAVMGYRKWVDGWLNASAIYFMYHAYSSEILRTNPAVNRFSLMLSGEVNYVKGLSNGDMFLIGGRIHALPFNMVKQKGFGRFVNLELHIGMRM